MVRCTSSPHTIRSFLGGRRCGRRAFRLRVGLLLRDGGRGFRRGGVPHVVAVRRDAHISDKSSKIFAKSFYLALLVGRTVRQAFDIGQATVEAAPGAARR